MLKKMFFLAAVFFILTSPSFATDLQLGNTNGGESIWMTSMWDLRTLHSSLDVGGRVGSPGGWFLSLGGPVDSSMGQVKRVEFIGGKRTINLTQGAPYYWNDHDEIGFNIWFGNRTEADDEFWMRCYDENGYLINIYEDGVLKGTEYGPIYPDIDLPALPFVTIKNMKVRRNDLMIKVDVPADTVGRNIFLVLRIYDGQDTDRMIHQINYTSDLSDNTKLSVPLEYAGYTARIEYRATGNGYPMARTVTWLVLPSD